MKTLYRIILLGISLMFPSVVSAQTTVNGIVRTYTGETLPGVAVSEKGTSKGYNN